MTLLPPIGSGPPLVYLPGLDGTGELLFPHEDALTRRFRLLRIPSREARPFDYDDLVGDVVAALDAEGIGRATVLGESFGSTVALRLALEHPDRVERLLLVSGFAYFPDRTLLRLGRSLGRIAPAAFLQSVRRAVVVPMLAVDGVAEEHRRRFVRTTLSRPFDGYLGRVELVSRFDVRSLLPNVTVPTLVMAGDGDKLVPNGCSVELARLLPNARLHVLRGAGHACLLAPGVRVAEIIEEWAAAKAGVGR